MNCKRTSVCLWLLITMAMMPPVISHCAESDSFPSFDQFERIVKRNIFDPNRQADTPPAAPVERPDPPPTVESKERIYLIGTLLTDRKQVALFEGDKNEYNKDVQQGGQLEKFTVEAISISSVSLVNGESKLDLPVGSALERSDAAAEWRIVDASPAGSSSSSSDHFDRSRDRRPPPDDWNRRDQSPGTERSSASSGSTEAPDSIMQRLIERRKREMGE
ncbi:hypothetical protein JXA32_14715 [Candidatus Sumerlaeota bacterium]|nr:hypothetical protein [Candidatus Sumerlaeota bacterium]